MTESDTSEASDTSSAHSVVADASEADAPDVVDEAQVPLPPSLLPPLALALALYHSLSRSLSLFMITRARKHAYTYIHEQELTERPHHQADQMIYVCTLTHTHNIYL